MSLSDFDRQSIAVIRGLAVDAPHAAKSGHQGTAVSLAPLAHTMWTRIMKFDPVDPSWPDRDRFVLSAGHVSILQYSMLFLAGYGTSIDDLKSFRQWGSATPGHPEAGHTAGVEVTTGPLGQGIANAVGMALAERRLRAQFGEEIIDHHTYAIVSDGDLSEGVSHEAASLAGHQRLDRLVAIYDDNRITIDGSTDVALSDDVVARFQSYGWNVIDAGAIAEDVDALEQVINQAKAHVGAPTLIVLRTHIGFPSPTWADKPAAHGLCFDDATIAELKTAIGIPDEPFYAPDELVAEYRKVCSRGAAARSSWSRQVSKPWSKPATRRKWLTSSACNPPVIGRGVERDCAVHAVVGDRFCRPLGQHRNKAERCGPHECRHARRFSNVLRHPRARDGFGDGRHGHARRRLPRGGDVPRVQRLHAPSRAFGRTEPSSMRVRVVA